MSASPSQIASTHSPKVIGIAGASGFGKSYLATSVAAALGAPVLSVDSYYRNLAHLPFEERAQQNFDHPDSLDWPLLLEHLQSLSDGHPVAIPEYDFSTHTRKHQTHWLQPGPFLVLEGILALHQPRVRRLLALKVFVDLDAEECLRRRIERDVRERGRTPQCVLDQYHATVLPMFLEFVRPTVSHADLCVRGDASIAASTEAVLAALGVQPPTPAGLAYSGL
ncbi:MAG: uridine kinase [Bryobacterales bacterium]|nr:uridine kinase [Bryobacterales bacterium]